MSLLLSLKLFKQFLFNYQHDPNNDWSNQNYTLSTFSNKFNLRKLAKLSTKYDKLCSTYEKLIKWWKVAAQQPNKKKTVASTQIKHLLFIFIFGGNFYIRNVAENRNDLEDVTVVRLSVNLDDSEKAPSRFSMENSISFFLSLAGCWT